MRSFNCAWSSAEDETAQASQAKAMVKNLIVDNYRAVWRKLQMAHWIFYPEFLIEKNGGAVILNA
jgi:hypothetical protein